MNNQILGVNTDLQSGWKWKRADGLFRLAKMTFALPPKAEQEALVTYGMNSLTAIDSLLGSVKESIHLLREKRASLISAAVTGEMAVPK